MSRSTTKKSISTDLYIYWRLTFDHFPDIPAHQRSNGNHPKQGPDYCMRFLGDAEPEDRDAPSLEQSSFEYIDTLMDVDIASSIAQTAIAMTRSVSGQVYTSDFFEAFKKVTYDRKRANERDHEDGLSDTDTTDSRTLCTPGTSTYEDSVYGGSTSGLGK